MATEDVKLSKNVLRMKFMHKSAIRIEREKNEEEQQKVIDDEHWMMDLPEYQRKESKFQKDMGYVFCEDLEFGRHSFKGFNAEVEKLMKIHRAKKLEKETAVSEEKKEEDQDNVDEEEMANRYNTLIGVIAKKFTKKRQKVTREEEKDDTLIDELPPNKFIKPTLD